MTMTNKHTVLRCVSNAAICYTLVTLALSAAFYTLEEFATSFAPSFGVLFGVLCFSLVFGFSGMFFDIKSWTSAPKRVCHFSVNFVAYIVVFSMINGEFILSQVMAGAFVFIVTYLLCAGIGALYRLIVGKYHDTAVK